MCDADVAFHHKPTGQANAGQDYKPRLRFGETLVCAHNHCDSRMSVQLDSAPPYGTALPMHCLASVM